jgi:hypothetical protein
LRPHPAVFDPPGRHQRTERVDHPVLADGASIVFTVGVGVTRGRPGGTVQVGYSAVVLAR